MSHISSKKHSNAAGQSSRGSASKGQMQLTSYLWKKIGMLWKNYGKAMEFLFWGSVRTLNMPICPPPPMEIRSHPKHQQENTRHWGQEATDSRRKKRYHRCLSQHTLPLWLLDTSVDGSAEDAARNGGAGVCVQHSVDDEEHVSIPTWLHSTNYKAEAMALEEAATILERSERTKDNVVFLTDALSVLQSIKSNL